MLICLSMVGTPWCCFIPPPPRSVLVGEGVARRKNKLAESTWVSALPFTSSICTLGSELFPLTTKIQTVQTVQRILNIVRTLFNDCAKAMISLCIEIIAPEKCCLVESFWCLANFDSIKLQ